MVGFHFATSRLERRASLTSYWLNGQLRRQKDLGHLATKMKMLTYTIAVSMIGLLAGASEVRPKVAVKTFENPANAARSTIGDGLTEILTTELQNTGKFNVLERSNVDELMKEMNFGSSEYTNNATFAQKGAILGAQYLLMGKVTNFSYTERAERKQKINLFGPDTIQTVFQQKADVRVDFRLIDIATGETVISQAGEASKANTSEVSELATWLRIQVSGSVTAELSSSLIGRATTEATKDMVRKLNALSNSLGRRAEGAAIEDRIRALEKAKGQLVAEEGGGLWIVAGIGSANGLQKADRLVLSHENVVKDAKGNIVYRRPVNIGGMEVTDVSQPDRAEVRFTPLTPGGQVPQVNDSVTVDVEFARNLRGDKRGVTPANAPTNAGSPASTAQLDEILKRASSYVTDRFWSQALDEYKRAAALDANDPRVLQGQALSHYMLGDFVEGDAAAEKLLSSGGPFTFPIAHFHAMSTCTGLLTIQHGKLAYSGGKSDGFDIGPDGFVGIEVRKLAKGLVTVEKLADWPVLEVRWRGQNNKENKFQMLPYMFSKQQSLSGKNFASAFPMDDSDAREMQKFEQSVVQLIQKFLK